MRVLEKIYPNTFSSRNMGLYQTLDYGCGKGFDADYYGIEKYDPYYFPEYPTKLYDVVVCNYVLNVVSEQEEAKILTRVFSLLKATGIGIFSVRRDLPEQGRMMSGYMQRYSKPRNNLFLESPMVSNYIMSIYKKYRAFEIYEIDKRGIDLYHRVRGPVNNS